MSDSLPPAQDRISRLPPFSDSIRVSPDQARFDRIKLKIGDWHIRGFVDTLAAFFDLLGPYPTPTLERPHGPHNVILATNRRLTPQDYGWMFNRPGGTIDMIRSLSFRRRRGLDSGSRANDLPLVSGRLCIRDTSPRGPDVYQDTIAKWLYLDVSLNLTRYIAHQPFPRSLAEPWRLSELPEPNLRIQSRPPDASPSSMMLGGQMETEIPLTHDDNVLLGVRRHLYTPPGSWPLHLGRYITGLEQAISQEFGRAAAIGGLSQLYPNDPTRTQSYYNLSEVETYFEFFDPNATRRVRLLEQLLAPIGLRNTTRRYRDGLAERGVIENSLSVRIVLESGRELRVYAKTTKRIRFEVIYDLSNPSVNELLNVGENRKTTTSLEELIGWFQILAADAAQNVNRVLDEIASYSRPNETAATTYEFLSAIYSTINNTDRAEAIIQLLVENGFVRVGKSPAPLLADIRQLRRRGILGHCSGSERVTARFREALALLRRQAAATLDEESPS